jgi:phage-related baseplate assembly protein
MAIPDFPPEWFPPLPGTPGRGPVITAIAEGDPLFGFDSSIVPDIDFAVKDASQIQIDVINRYEQIFYLQTQIKKTLARGDPVRLFLLSIIYQLAVQRSIVDSTGKQNLIKYSVGPNLDNLGARWGNRGKRAAAKKAKTVLQFTRTDSTTVEIVPQGTIAQTNDNHQFETDLPLILTIGALTGDVGASALNPGTEYNGFVPGQINSIVQTAVPFLAQVTNTVISSGGAPIEPDSRLRARIWFAPESFSTAGPMEAYEYWAGSANTLIIDISAYSAPAIAGEVHLYVLMEGGRLPTQIELDEVYTICDDERIRPLTDYVFSEVPTVIPYDIGAYYYIGEEDAIFLDSIQARVTEALAEYIYWQRTKIGRDVNPSRFSQYLMNAGAKWVNIPTAPDTVVLNPGPYFSKVNKRSVAQEVNVNLVFGGISTETTPYRLPRRM